MIGVDENENNRADPWELLRWIEWVEEVYQGVCKYVPPNCVLYLFIVSVSGVPKCNLSSFHSMFLSSNGGVLELIHIPQPSNKLLMKILQPKKIVQVLDGPTISTSNDRMGQKIRKTKKEGTRS